jgi:hypothetical protein
MTSETGRHRHEQAECRRHAPQISAGFYRAADQHAGENWIQNPARVMIPNHLKQAPTGDLTKLRRQIKMANIIGRVTGAAHRNDGASLAPALA